MLQLFKGDTFLYNVRPNATFTLPNGGVVSPAVVGWANSEGYSVRATPSVSPADLAAAERDQMACTPMQGKLALGEANWQKVLDFRDGTGVWAEQGRAPWPQRTIIDSAQTWVRNSQNIQFFQYLLNYTDAQVDDLFRAAAAIDA